MQNFCCAIFKFVIIMPARLCTSLLLYNTPTMQVPSVHGFVLPELGSGMDPCLKNCSSNNSTQVICGSDGQTYANECELENARCDDEGLSVASDGPCAEPEDCIKDCSKETLSEVCGSNAVTYANECEFNNAQCEVEDNDVFIIYHDPCVTLPPPPGNDTSKPGNSLINFRPSKLINQLYSLYTQHTQYSAVVRAADLKIGTIY